jgi:hypothetical protein
MTHKFRTKNRTRITRIVRIFAEKNEIECCQQSRAVFARAHSKSDFWDVPPDTGFVRACKNDHALRSVISRCPVMAILNNAARLFL